MKFGMRLRGIPIADCATYCRTSQKLHLNQNSEYSVTSMSCNEGSLFKIRMFFLSISSGVFHSGVCWTKYEIVFPRKSHLKNCGDSRGSVRTNIHYSNDKIRLKSEINPWKIILYHIHAILLDKINGIQWKSCPSTSVTLKLRKLVINFIP